MLAIQSNHFKEKKLLSSIFHKAWLLPAIILFLLMITITACQSAGEEGGLVGVWNDGYTFIEFNKDGTWGTAGMYESITSDSPISYGTYQFDDSQLTFVTDEESNFCPGGSGTYEIEFTDQGELIFTPLDEECSGRKFDLTRNSYTRYSP